MSAPSDLVSFASLRIAAFESRRAGEMERMIARRGGVPLVSPSMREVPLERNQAAVDFANRLITGQIDVIVFLDWRGHANSGRADRAVRRSQSISGGRERHQVGRAGPETASGTEGTGHHTDADRARAEHVAGTAANARRKAAGGQSSCRSAGIRRHESQLASRPGGPRGQGGRGPSLRVGFAGRLRAAGGEHPPHRGRRGGRRVVHLGQSGGQHAEAGRRPGAGR